MARRSDESVGYVGTGGWKGGGREEWETNDRRRRTEMDGRIEKNHLATGHYNNT